MSHRIDAAKITIATIAGNGANYVVIAASAIGLTQELNQTYLFMHLNLPIWLFFALALLLSLVGSFWSLYIDTMREADLNHFQKVVNLLLGFMTGIVGAFIVLPAFTASPPMPVMLLTSLGMSFIGTVLIKNIGEIIRSVELWGAVKSLFIDVLRVVKELMISRLRALAALFLGGGK